MNLLREYIRELLKEEGTLGKYAWPSAIKNHPVADEPDTDIEEMLYQQLHNHFGAISALDNNAVAAIQQILDSGEYSNTFARCASGKQKTQRRRALSKTARSLKNIAWC